MHRFYLAPESCQSDQLRLSGAEAHHAIHVLRLQPRQRAVVLDGAGGELLCEVTGTDRHDVTLKVLQKNTIPPLTCQVTLLQAITKGKSMDVIVQKATELGVTRIVPLLSERSVIRLDEGGAAAKIEKWEATAIEAIKQCGSAWLPEIDPPSTPSAFLARPERMELSLVASLQPEARHPREYFNSFRDEWKRPPKSVAVWIGPEGDFTPAEINLIRAAGVWPISLGPLVLRSETAAIYCLAILHYELQSPHCQEAHD